MRALATFPAAAALLAVTLISPSAMAVDRAAGSAYGKLFIGGYDAFRANQDSQYGVEYEFERVLSRYGFKPAVGLLRTRGASHYLYSSLSRTSSFNAEPTGLALSVAFGPGLYLHGGNDDTDLGHLIEFRTSAGLLWVFGDQTRLGLHFSHLSNASISPQNPGTELVTLSYELPW